MYSNIILLWNDKQGTNVAHNVTGGLLIDLTLFAIALLLSMSLKLTDITQWNVGACSSFRTVFVVDKVVPVRVLISVKFNYMYFITSLRGKNEVKVKFENSMHNYKATLVHWHHTLGCQCSNFNTYAVHKVVPVRVSIAAKFNYFITSLRGKNEVEVKFENSMHNYNATLVHWHHTLGCQCSSFSTYAVHKVVPIRVLICRKIELFYYLAKR